MTTPAHETDAALPDGVTPIGATVGFSGGGYGHGVGLSQYGARGRALAGQTAGTILAHYYRNTSLGTLDPATTIRVLLLSSWAASKSAPFVLLGRDGAWTVDGIRGLIPAGAKLTLTPSIATTSTGMKVAWRMKVFAADGRMLYDAARSSAFRVRPAASKTRLELAAKPTGRNRYRATLRIFPRTDSPRVSAVNEILLEQYLAGVVPAEMPASWPTEALRAQAIVARSYAARALRPATSAWDVYDDTRSQVYHGVLAERATTNAAVTGTAGRVVRYGTALANTVFHSTAGGHTEHNENVFVSATGVKVAGPVAYLRGVPDRRPDGSAFDAGAPYAAWTSATWTAAQLSGFLAADGRTNVGTVLGLDLRDRGVSGRLISVTVHGTTGVKRVSGDVFRGVVNARKPTADRSIRSNLFQMVTPAP